jgi:uncharacterized protein YkwD
MATTRWLAAAAAAAAAALVLTTGGASYAGGGTQPTPAASVTPAGPPAAGYSATGTWQLLALVNKYRRSAGLQPLTVDTRLANIARAHTERMAASNDLRHNDVLFTPVSHTALRMKALGENVGWNYSVTEQHAAFIKSAGHRANMRMGSFRVAGFAVVRDKNGRIWSTEDFGTPAG